MKSLVLGLIVSLCINTANAQCTFPSDMIGLWQTSTLEVLNFTDTASVIIPNVHTYGDIQFNCDTKSGEKYLLRSVNTVANVFGTLFYAATCFEFTSITTDVKYNYFHATAPNAQAGNERMALTVSGSVLTTSLCNEQPPAYGTLDLMIKEGSVSSAVVKCPDPVLGQYSYTVDGQCYSNSSLDVCTDKQRWTLDYNTCSNTVAYSSGGDLSCVYSSEVNSTTYLTLYNNDNTTDETSTFRFTCLVLAINGSNNVVQATQYPQHCLAGQTTTTVLSPGLALELSPNVTCVYDPTTTSAPVTTATTTTITPEPQVGSASTAAGVSVAVVAIIVLVVLLLFFLVFRKGAPYPINRTRCNGSKCCGRFLDCLSCQCCCPNRSRVEPGDQESVLTTEDVGVTAKDDPSQQVTGNGREVDVIPAPAPSKPSKNLDEITSDIVPKKLPPLEKPSFSLSSIDETEEKLPSKLPPIDSPKKDEPADKPTVVEVKTQSNPEPEPPTSEPIATETKNVAQETPKIAVTETNETKGAETNESNNAVEPSTDNKPEAVAEVKPETVADSTIVTESTDKTDSPRVE